MDKIESKQEDDRLKSKHINYEAKSTQAKNFKYKAEILKLDKNMNRFNYMLFTQHEHQP